MRAQGAVPNLCKADSGLSAMIGILVAISSHQVRHRLVRAVGILELVLCDACSFGRRACVKTIH